MRHRGRVVVFAAEEMIAMSVLAAFAVPHPPLIVPGVGHGRESGISATVEAYREVGRRIAALAPETIVISSPHSTAYLDYLHISGGPGASGTFAQFGDARDGSVVEYDEGFVHALCDAADAEGVAAGTAGERTPDLDWGVLVPLHFVQEAYEQAHAAGAGRGEKTAAGTEHIPQSGQRPRAHHGRRDHRRSADRHDSGQRPVSQAAVRY